MPSDRLVYVYFIISGIIRIVNHNEEKTTWFTFYFSEFCSIVYWLTFQQLLWKTEHMAITHDLFHYIILKVPLATLSLINFFWHIN
jgi:hypothetical protein